MSLKDPNIIECRVRLRAATTAHSARVHEIAAKVPGVAVAPCETAEGLRILATSPAALTAVEQALAAAHLAVDFGAPQVIYVATLQQTAESECRIDGLDGSPDAFAVVRLRLVPLPRGSGLIFETEFEGPPPIDIFNGAVEQAARASASGLQGGLTLTDLRIVFTGGAFHPTRSNAAAFAAGATEAFTQACRDGQLKRLEPSVAVAITVPRDDVRSVVNDLASCRGREVRRALTPKGVLVEAHLPLGVALTYQERLKTLTEDRARLISAPVFAGFAEKPA